MELREWQYMNKPAGSAANNSSSGYKKRFEKLIKYHIDHASSELESITKKDIKDDGFWLSEHYNNSHHEFNRDLIVSYDKDSDTFFFRIFIDGKEIDNILRNSYEDFVVAAEPYMFLPDAGTQEYDDLLTESLNEWKAMNSSTSSASSKASSSTFYKDKFKKLLGYHISNYSKNKSQGFEVLDYQINKLYENADEAYFKYIEIRMDSTYGNVVDFVVEAYYYKASKNWTTKVWLDSDQKLDKSGTGFNNLIDTLSAKFHAPLRTSKEWQELLEWKAVSPPSTSKPATYPSQEERYKKLLAQIDTDVIAKYKVNELTDTVLDFNVNTKYRPAGYRVKIEYNSATDDFNLQVADGTILKGNDWNEDILTLFGAGAILRETDLLRESHSLADDFRLYENLWD